MLSRPMPIHRSGSSRPRGGFFLASASRYISGTTSRDHESCPASWSAPGAIAVHFRLSGLDLYAFSARSVLLIRGFGVRVPGGAPILTWGFTTPGSFFASVLSPCLLRVCSSARSSARTQQFRGCQKRPSGAGSGGMRHDAGPLCPASAAPASVNHWSRPHLTGTGNPPGAPMPMVSLSVKPAGNRHSCG